MTDFQNDLESEFIKLAQRVFNPPQDCYIQINTFNLFEIIGFIQFAWRGAEQDPRIQAKIRQSGELLTDILCTTEPELRPHIERGWRTEFDVRNDTHRFENENAAIAQELIHTWQQEQPDPLADAPDKPLYTLELLVHIESDGFGFVPLKDIPPGDLPAMAVLNIPHHTADAIFAYDFHVAGSNPAVPLIHEMILLQQHIEQIHETYHHLTELQTGDDDKKEIK